MPAYKLCTAREWPSDTCLSVRYGQRPAEDTSVKLGPSFLYAPKEVLFAGWLYNYLCEIINHVKESVSSLTFPMLCY